MKKIILAMGLSWGLMLTAWSQQKIKIKDLKLPNGTTIENVMIWKNDETTANYSFKGRTSSGFGTVKMVDLDAESQRKLGYDSAKQKAFEQLAEVQKKERDDALTIISLALDAKTGSAGRKSTKSWETSWGSYNKDIAQNYTIDVSLRNGTDNTGAVYIEVLWLTNGSDGKGQIIGASSISRKKMILNPREIASGAIQASFRREDNKYAALGIREQTGSGYAGWVVRAVDPDSGKVLAVKASGTPLVMWSDSYKVGKKSDF